MYRCIKIGTDLILQTNLLDFALVEDSRWPRRIRPAEYMVVNLSGLPETWVSTLTLTK